MRVANDDHDRCKAAPGIIDADHDIMSVVEQIDGDYAHLRRTDLPDEELKLVARALLPAEIVEGCTLHYELMQYTIL